MAGNIGAMVGQLGSMLKNMTADIVTGKGEVETKGDTLSLVLSNKEITDCGVADEQADAVRKSIKAVQATSITELWLKLSKTVLTKALPFALHELCFNKIYTDDDKPRVCWAPSDRNTNMQRMMKGTGASTPAEFHKWSVDNREAFWQKTVDAMNIQFSTPYSKIFTGGVENIEYMKGARLNIADSCFQAHPNADAIVYRIEGSDELHRWSYRELEQLTNRVANSLVKAGFKKGDTIGMCCIMTAESVAIYLGIVKAGCAVVSIADSFSAAEIQTRMTIAKSKAMFTQDWIYRGGKRHPLFQRVVEAGVEQCIVMPGNFDTVDGIEMRKSDMTWENFLKGASAEFTSVQMGVGEPSNVLFSSGTTGEPKAIPWSHASPMKAGMDGHLHHNIRAGDVISWPTNIGWMMGPWLIYASLLNGASIALFAGGPGGKEFCKFIQDSRATFVGVVPSLVKAWKASNATAEYDWSAVKRFSSTGESSSPMMMLWLMAQANYAPVVEYCGGTEIAGGYVCGSMDMPQSPSCFSIPGFGLDFVLLAEDGTLAAKEGEVALVCPSIGLSTFLMNRDHTKAYFTGMPKGPNGDTLRRHGDHFERMGDGFYRALGRVDDTMNLGGIKVSSVELERSCNIVDGVAETAAIAINPKGGGPSLLVVYTVLSEGSSQTEDSLTKAFQASIKTNLNPLFRVSSVVIINALPRTASNKVMRRTLRDMFCTANNMERLPSFTSTGDLAKASGVFSNSGKAMKQ